jgi:hypothetical protein
LCRTEIHGCGVTRHHAGAAALAEALLASAEAEEADDPRSQSAVTLGQGFAHPFYGLVVDLPEPAPDRTGCRWPDGCTETRVTGRPYCKHHLRVAYKGHAIQSTARRAPRPVTAGALRCHECGKAFYGFRSRYCTSTCRTRAWRAERVAAE